MSKKNRSKNKDLDNNCEVKKEDRSPRIQQKPKIDWELKIKEREDLTMTQKLILEKTFDKDFRCCIIDGYYGTGKSFLCVLSALKLLNSGKVKKIYYIRNPLESSTSGKLGFLPAGISEKMGPYSAVLTDKLEELLSKEDIAKLEKDDRIESLPIGYLRGRSFAASAIIVDECASMTWEDLMLIISRCGEYSRIYFVGDNTFQNEMGNKSGFKKFFNFFDDTESKDNGIFTYELKDDSDIVRSKFLRFVMNKVRRLNNGGV